MESRKDIVRCSWVSNDPLYVEYHDEEWGIPVYNNQKLFQMLCLEGQQAGLSWITILKKRQKYNELFHDFDPYKIILLKETDIQTFLTNTGIVRHKGKIEAIINNARCYIEMQEKGVDFSDFIWKFVDDKPIINNWNLIQEVPSETEISKNLSNSLKKQGFKYVGSTICYSFMQACGLVNDHIVNCICRNKT
ncbi:DNA-3-methyladenine glycosylase 1-like [Zerene cesonia]|uniref:DNA-3-methyladenine glycosylase 1-like n=1 Tax=Zerene cesonia TaxID=33412 RepID=UPI0018E54F2C|nr:DNA-3-methyladenine glycosylase 1-like [Zerene cesonia]